MRLPLFILLLFSLVYLYPQRALCQDVTIKRSSVIEQYKGRPCYIHFVKQGETLSAISKAYNVTNEELIIENPVIEKGLKADMVLRIPKRAFAAGTEGEKAKVEKPKETAKPTDNADYVIYEVKKQETLYGISKQYNLTVDDILAYNPGIESLQEGMELKIPTRKPDIKTLPKDITEEKAIVPELRPGEVVVKTGETLYSLAKAHNTNIDQLIELNPQLSGGLKAGMIIVIQKIATDSIPKPGLINTPGIKPTPPGKCFSPHNIKKTYEVALLLPLLLDEATTVLEASENRSPSYFENFNYFQFYAGFMLAADSLEKSGLHARIHVMDADKLNDTLFIRQALRKPGMDKMDLLVGPLYATSFTIAAHFAQKNKIAIINPLSKRENIVDGNPYVIKTQTSGPGMAAKLSEFILNKYPKANVIAVRNDKKEFKSLADDFIAFFKEGDGKLSFKGNVSEVLYANDKMPGVTQKLKPGVANIVIFFSNNKTIVPNFVSLLSPNAKSNEIVLVGMDGWDEIDLETEFLVNLNYHQITTAYIDYDSEAVQQFITRFRNKYGAMPLASKHAFLGYDLGWYFLTSLMWYGNDFISCLSANKGDGLQNDFMFPAPENGNGLQNQEVKIVKLQDYKMILAD